MHIVDYGVDWLTLTTESYFGPDSPEAAALRNLVRRDWYGGQSGLDVAPWGWKGYAGLSFGPLSIGARRDGSIVRCSGPAARLLGRMPWGADWTCTRIDLQATIDVDGRDIDTCIRELEAPALAARAGVVGRPWKVRLVKGNGDGDTLLCGSRTSAMYVRVYNKYAESSFDDEFRGCMRMEVELKNGVADRIFWQLAGKMIGDTRPAEILATALKSRGIVLPWDGEKCPEEWLKHVTRETDAERQLAWLEKSVAGVVRKLVGQGLRDLVLDALDLGGVAEPFTPGE